MTVDVGSCGIALDMLAIIIIRIITHEAADYTDKHAIYPKYINDGP